MRRRIRGQLRWWMRLLDGVGKPEYVHFGGIKGIQLGYEHEAVASAWKITLLADPNNNPPESCYIIPHKKPKKAFKFDALPPGQRYCLSWHAQPHPEFKDAPSPSDRESFTRILKTWMLLGTVGRRATRAMGSVWPIDFLPTVDEFSTTLTDLNLPSSLKWQVLDPVGTQEELTHIAGETVHGLNKDDFQGNPLGFVGGRERKSSALRFKVGRFNDGLRLIAIWDNRVDRGGDLKSAIAGMAEALKSRMGSFFATTPATEPSDMNSVGSLLAAELTYDSFARFKSQIEEWQAAGMTDQIARFVELTQEKKYGGLRQQPWYQDIS